MDKINFLKKSYKTLSNTVEPHLLIAEDGTPKEFIKNLKLLFPSLSDNYLTFLNLYNGLGLDWITLYGSQESKLPSLLETIDIWKEAHELDLIKLGCCPIGEDAGADLYCLNEKGEVVMFDSESYEEPQPQFIANSFDEFINECVLGKRYLEFMEEDDFYHFLKAQGWA